MSLPSPVSFAFLQQQSNWQELFDRATEGIKSTGYRIAIQNAAYFADMTLRPFKRPALLVQVADLVRAAEAPTRPNVPYGTPAAVAVYQRFGGVVASGSNEVERLICRALHVGLIGANAFDPSRVIWTRRVCATFVGWPRTKLYVTDKAGYYFFGDFAAYVLRGVSLEGKVHHQFPSQL